MLFTRPLVTLLLVACGGGPSTPSEDIRPDAVSDATAIRAVLAEKLGTPDVILARMLGHIGTDCAGVVDPEDPGACAPETTCRATALTRTAGGWSVAAIGVREKLPPSTRCASGALQPLAGLD